jgi:hypothetical protein
MFKNDFYNNALYPTKGINSVGWRISLHGANGFFVFGRDCYLVFLHSFHRSDYIETNKSGGHSTDCLSNTSLCSDDTVIIGREERIRQMLKTVKKSQLIGTLN